MCVIICPSRNPMKCKYDTNKTIGSILYQPLLWPTKAIIVLSEIVHRWTVYQHLYSIFSEYWITIKRKICKKFTNSGYDLMISLHLSWTVNVTLLWSLVEGSVQVLVSMFPVCQVYHQRKMLRFPFIKIMVKINVYYGYFLQKRLVNEMFVTQCKIKFV